MPSKLCVSISEVITVADVVEDFMKPGEPQELMNLKTSLVPTVDVIGSPVTALSFQEQIDVILQWACVSKSTFVCVANTHMLIEAYRVVAFSTILQSADLITPDGMPLVWMLKLLGVRSPDRVAGMDILLALCQQAPLHDVSVFFVGSQSEILDRMQCRLKENFPGLKIAGMEPLPFAQTAPNEDEALIKKINDSGAKVVFVSLGCPKQEYWMASHKHKIHAVMIGLGGVFPIYAGIHKYAPKLLRESGFEWLYRLSREPRRLWKRYASTIPIFVWLASKQVFKGILLIPKQESKHQESAINNNCDN
jgi:N-acetylglucosaminyldiphosphoundecaprenol N-acetyl-beta-D-mannosaminyltransferase